MTKSLPVKRAAHPYFPNAIAASLPIPLPAPLTMQHKTKLVTVDALVLTSDENCLAFYSVSELIELVVWDVSGHVKIR